MLDMRYVVKDQLVLDNSRDANGHGLALLGLHSWGAQQSVTLAELLQEFIII